MDYGTAINLADVIENYQAIRQAAHTIATADRGAAMGNSQWLRNALRVEDIEFTVTETGILCHGMTFTSQTQGQEEFEFEISVEDLRDEMGS